MTKITLNSEIIKFIALFEQITRAHVKDCFFSKDKLVFVVQEGEIGKALGKKKFNLHKLEQLLNRKIKIVEFNSHMLQFIVNRMYPLKIEDMTEEEGIVTITGSDMKTKGLMIGARAQNLRNYEETIKRYFPELKEIKVI